MKVCLKPRQFHCSIVLFLFGSIIYTFIAALSLLICNWRFFNTHFTITQSIICVELFNKVIRSLSFGQIYFALAYFKFYWVILRCTCLTRYTGFIHLSYLFFNCTLFRLFCAFWPSHFCLCFYIHSFHQSCACCSRLGICYFYRIKYVHLF